MMPVLENSNIFVLDNGGGQLKAGHSNMPSPRIIPNCVTKAKSEKEGSELSDNNSIMHQWFRGKCIMDESWCH